MSGFWNRLTGEESRQLNQELANETKRSKMNNKKHREEMKQNQVEMRKLKEQKETENKRHLEEIKQIQQQIQHAEREHQQKLGEMNKEIADMGKISRKRVKLLKKMVGESTDFPRGVSVPSRLFISLFGEIGTGKTSLINSLKYTIDGSLKDHQRLQAATNNFEGSHTIESLEVVMTKHLSVIDNRGINAEKVTNATLQEDIIRQMEGRYELGTVIWQSLPPGHDNEEDKKSYCSVLVFSAHNANVARKYRSFIERLRKWQGRFPLAVITHVDEVSSQDVRMALQSGGIGDIYEVANITSERKDISTDHKLQLLDLLVKCFNDGDSIFLRRQEITRGK